MIKVVIVGGGFGGINAAKKLAKNKEIEITLIDKNNYHLFQPLLYQVAMAGLSPAEIAKPIRSMFSGYNNIKVLQCDVHDVDKENKKIITRLGSVSYDYLILACGSKHGYFGHNEWEEYAPGLKTIEQATEIRRRVLQSYEMAEIECDPDKQKAFLTFIVVGGGPTGVELAGAIGEMSRFTLAKDFKNIDPTHARVILIEAASRILLSYPKKLADKAMRDLEKIGVQVWTSSMVTKIDKNGINIKDERIHASTVLWAAGVEVVDINKKLKVELDKKGRVLVSPDLSIPDYPEIFVIGDQASFLHQDGKPLPGIAPVAIQQGRFAARCILNEIKGKLRKDFKYIEKGQMTTIGRSRAIAEIAKLKFSGFFAWLIWLFVHIYFLSGFKNRLFVFIEWAWYYISFGRGARLIIGKEWRMYSNKDK